MKTTRLSILPSLTIFLTFLTLLFATATQAQVPSYVPTNGLVGYWPFNGNANDESGNGNNGAVNGAMPTEDRNGQANSAYYFSSIDCATYIDAQINTASINGAITISFWVYRTNNGCIAPRIMKFYAPSDGPGTHVFGWPNDSDNPSMAFVTSTLDYAFIQYNSISNSSWSHLTYTNNGLIANVYQDGLLLFSNTSTGIVTLAGNANFGRMTNPANDAFNGKIDDIGIWNRALTADEVLALYNGCIVTPQAVSGNTTPGAFANSTYTCNNNAGSTYTWTVNNGVIVSGQGTNSVTILWGAEGVGSVSVLETTADGCIGDEVIYDVDVQCVVSGNEITGPVGPEAFSNLTYTCNGAANSTYNWTVTNGVIASGQGTNTVNILWASTGLGNVSVVETTAEGCVGTTLSQDVVVIPTNVEELANQLILFPNPATTELNLQITSDLIGTDLFVFDALGKQILKQQILSTNTIINTSSFAAGNYVVKVGGGVKKFAVEK